MIVLRAEPMTEEWVQSLQVQFQACQTAEELLNASADLYAFRRATETYLIGVKLFRGRMNEIWPDRIGRTVVVIDLPCIHHAAFSVCNGRDGANELCLKMVRNIAKETQANFLLVATDCRQGISKFEKFPKYKADRGDKATGFKESLDDSIQSIKDAGIELLEFDGLEADDIMCSTSYRCRLVGQHVVIVTNDRDLWQALGPGAAIMVPSSREFQNDKWLMANHSIKPSQAVDWMCLVGKNNIPGADGIAGKTASKWLQAYGDFHGIMDAIESLTKAKRESLQELAARYWEVHALHTLSREAPVTWGPGKEMTWK
jgi:5'-3' exonuclease